MSDFDFLLHPLPAIHFGAGRFSTLGALASSFGSTVLLVTGLHALQHSGKFSALLEQMHSAGLQPFHCMVEGEPSPELVDSAVAEFRQQRIDVVLAVGGGSVLDSGKAISAMLRQEEPVEIFIEGREGFIPYNGCKVPFIAVPTTSGTGSEVTNNAVISRVGPNGFKRSLRHASLVPNIALIDPELMLTASPELTAASGMDACTQLIEAYTSPFASSFTDALVVSGLEHFSRSFFAACTDRPDEVALRSDIAYAALLSGIALANAGLGIVHGFASSVGGLFAIPHGALCATLLAEATKENIAALRRFDAGHPQLYKYARAGSILSGVAGVDVKSGCDALLQTLEEWQERLSFPELYRYGIRESDLDRIVADTRSKSNAVPLDDAAMKRILANRL